MKNKLNFDDFKKTFFNGGTNKKDLLKRIKVFITDFEDLLKFSSRFEKEIPTMKSLFKQVLLGKYYLPKSYSELGKNEQQYFTESLEQEINWNTLAFLKCSDTINQFLKLKDEFEHDLLIGNYENAREILDTIEKDICVSYWSIENRFILDEYQFGSEKNWETRNIILNEENDVFVQVLGNIYSVKAEKRVSFFQYNEDFNNWQEQQGLNNDKRLVELVEYSRFKANYFSYISYNHLAEILFRENSASIIDRYLLFIRVSQHHILNPIQENNNFIYLLKEMSSQIDDLSIEQMLICIDKPSVFQINNTNNQIISIIDVYTKGNYTQSVELSKAYLINNASNILELVEIYTKSLIELNSEYEKITETDSFLNQTSKVYFDILSKATNTDNAFVELVKLAYTFNNNHIGMQLYAFLKEELGWKTDIDYSFLARLNSKFINPKLLGSILQGEEISKNFIQNLLILHSESVTVRLFSNFYEYHLSNTTNNFTDIPEIKNEIYQVRNLMLLKEYEKCIEKYTHLLNQENLSIITQYEIVSNLYFCYLSENAYRNCIVLYVDTYLKNPHLTKKMNVVNVLEIVIKEKFRNLNNKQSLIELPIFLKNVCNDKLKVKQSYELFLKANDCKKPSEILLLQDDFEKLKLTYFLKNVCVTEIMQLSTVFESTEKVNAERIIVCQFLAQYDKDNFDFYNAEIAILTQKNTVSKVIGKIDEGKIYVNENKLRDYIVGTQSKNEIIKSLDNSKNRYLNSSFFNRVIELKNFTKNNEYKQPLLIYAKEDKQGNIKIDNPVINAFKDMFLEIRDLFVDDADCGLDAYLSRRIRHGTLPNHLRSVFEKFNLVTSQNDGQYVSNDFWRNKLSLNGEQNQKLQLELANFSYKIDAVSANLKDNLIHCKSEKRSFKENAIFDFVYTDIDTMSIYLKRFQDIEKFDDFINQCFLELWDRTNKHITTVRTKIDTEIKTQYVDLLTDLDKKLIQISNRQHLTELLNSINLCRTEIQTKLSNISKWFRRSESSFEGEYELGILTETSIQITKNVYPNYHFKLDKDICESVNIKGEYHQHIIDLMNICLFNIIKHSELPCENLNARLNIQEQEDKLRMVFENCVADVEKHSTKLLAIKNNWEKPDMNVSQEGGTGFPKIKKIIHSDLGRKESNFSFTFDDQKLTIELSFELNGLKI